METSVLQRFRRAIVGHRDNLLSWWRSEEEHRTTCLGDSDVDGRSAVECMPVLAEFDRVLEHIDDGTFGRCTMCDGRVEPERLALDFTTCVCLDHYSDAQKRALERDLELAAEVQQHLFPYGVPAVQGIEIAAHAQPAHIVGGDYFDFFCMQGAAQGVAIADVMGKGLAASMLMANLQASLRILGPELDDLDNLAGRLNTLFRYNQKLVGFVSIFLLSIDVDTRLMRYCNAGHNPPLRWEARTASTQWLRPTGPALGLVPEPEYRSLSIPFAAGDVLVLYTDGLLETRNVEGEEFGEASLERFLRDHRAWTAERLLTGLWHAVEQFSGGRLHDDVALLVVKVQEDHLA